MRSPSLSPIERRRCAATSACPWFGGRRSCAALLLAAAVAGTTPTFVNTWKAPDAAPLTLRSGDVVVAMVISRNEGTRRSGEDALAAELSRRGLRVIPAYTVLSVEQAMQKESALATLRA